MLLLLLRRDGIIDPNSGCSGDNSCGIGSGGVGSGGVGSCSVGGVSVWPWGRRPDCELT